MNARLLFAACASLLLSTGAASAQPAPAATAKTEHLEYRLIGPDAPAAPGAAVHVALVQTIAPGWHTYWRNSGDAGQPTQITWTLPAGVKASEPVWPTPLRLREATLMTYGYKDKVVMPVEVRIPASAVAGSTLRLKARVDLLVCKDVCVPDGADLALDVKVGQAGAGGATLQAALDAAPRPLDAKGGAQLKDGQLTLAFAGPALAGVDPTGAYFFPYDARLIDHPSRQTVQRGPQGLTLTVKAASSLTALKGPVEGVLQIGSKAWEATARPGGFPLGASGQGEVPAADEAAAASPPAATAAGPAAFLIAVASGVIGGLILNLMPCVFPILAMKAAALARTSGHEASHARTHGLAFMAGSVATFMALAGLLLALRAAGQAVGWGFQLQSPAVTAGLALLMLAVAMNLSGVFEAGLSAQRAAGSVPVGGGLFGAFATGVLAVLVAAPCTAPFMAAATGYALTASAPLALGVFAALGVGLALPFALLSFSPALLARLPRPGQWMEGLRHLLAFPMYGAAAWLAWVFVQQANADGLGLLFCAGVTLAFALYLFGGAQRRRALGGGGLAGLLGAGLCVAGAIFLAVMAADAGAAGGGASAANAVERALSAEPYSPERLAELRGQGRQVFVNFTAAWCVTCKVNERVALSQPSVKAAFDSTHTAYLVGDWTKRDAGIAQTLAQHGRAGVPLYLVYKPAAAEPTVLPQLLTPDMVIKALDGH